MNDSYKEKVAKEFGRFIREARERVGLSQAEAARRVGCSRSYYCMIESGDREIYFTLSLKICSILDISIDDFARQMR